MDRAAFKEKIKGQFQGRKRLFVGVLSTTLSLVLIIVLSQSSSDQSSSDELSKSEKAKHDEKGSDVVDSVVGSYASIFESLQYKGEMVASALEVNRKLELENANLRRWIEEIRYDCTADQSRKKIGKVVMRLDQDTGARVGRVLAGISYSPPSHLLPPQLFTLAVSYMKAKEYEKAAVNLTFLTGLEDNDAYKKPRNFLLTGVAWYHLDHNKLATEYFNKVINATPGFGQEKKILQFQAQARLWMALLEQRQGSREGAQEWLVELLNHHPRSLEAEWINPVKLQDRMPGSKTQEKKEMNDGSGSEGHE